MDLESPCSRPSTTEPEKACPEFRFSFLVFVLVFLGLEHPVTRAGGLGVQLVPADQNEGRVYECIFDGILQKSWVLARLV